MLRTELAHAVLDSLEKVATVQEYHDLNNLTPEQRDRIGEKVAGVLELELARMGVKIE